TSYKNNSLSAIICKTGHTLYLRPMNTYISHVLSFSTTNGGQPRTYSVIIYLQNLILSLFSFSSYSEDAPTNVWVAHSWCLPVPHNMFPYLIVTVALLQFSFH